MFFNKQRRSFFVRKKIILLISIFVQRLKYHQQNNQELCRA